MKLDLSTYFPNIENIEALTPDGRWRILQDWLAENPEYGARVDDWLRETPEEVFEEIRSLIAQEHGVIAAMIMTGSREMQEQIKKTIEVLQACYRERKQIDKEAENARTRRAKRKTKTISKRSTG